ncbi:hypothetical protein [Algoriphagus litoralis]|uniref:hypothetical protein n=1 Tax=Algoriphagus litoralis TaxID=2202829 RepID=UPI001300AD41|nr:hypothetical protein [Algoriphagus litoralis]
MSTSKSMTPYSKVVGSLEEKGYGQEISVGSGGAQFGGSGMAYPAEELKIVKVYRFEGESDPADMSVIFAIQASDGTKGYLINAFGPYSGQDNEYYDDFIRRVPVEELEEM